MKPADAAAPTGSHQVLKTKKYVLTNVISQITAINARPIPDPPGLETISPPRLRKKNLYATVGGSLPQPHVTNASQKKSVVMRSILPGPLPAASSGAQPFFRRSEGSGAYRHGSQPAAHALFLLPLRHPPRSPRRPRRIHVLLQLHQIHLNQHMKSRQLLGKFRP